MKKLPFAAKIICGVILVLAVFASGFLFWVANAPIHDFNVWRLERNFYNSAIVHPDGSVLLEKKKYLGGPSWHGDQWCVYAIGEVRRASFSKADIRNVYRGQSTLFGKEVLPLKVFFADVNDWPYELPYTLWEEELHAMEPTKDAIYIVYVATGRPFYFDYRCDD